ncbi:DNA-binding CsgD family transcriptional regulator [Catenulispora sp. GAS73]|uniref:helix-turn-helix transcriptional regulator n=1 Tax=Catenulispora sp. GAS73 TaxID=3156269 RepID=UPI0035139B54
MALVERQEQLDLLDTLLREASAGSGRAAVVCGPVGTGKSALVDVFAERAQQAGASVLSAVCSAEESVLRWGVLRQLMRGVDLVSEAAGRLARSASAVGVAQTWLAEEVCRALLDVAEDTTLVLILDDAQCADPASAQCLSALARRARNSRLLILIAEPGPPDPPSELQLELMRRPSTHVIPVGPLSVRGVRALAATVPNAADPDGLHELSGGNPLLVTALLRAEGYGSAVLGCLRRGDAGMRDVAAGLAVLGTTRWIDRLLDRDVMETGAALRALEQAGVLHDGWFRDDSAREALLVDLGSEQRVHLHSRAADVTFEEGAPPNVVAEHLLAARRTPGAWAVPVLESAAGSALAEGSTELAIDLLKLACLACEDQTRLAGIRTTLLRARWRIDPSAPAPHMAELTDALHRGHLRGSDALVLTKALLWHGRFDTAREVLTSLRESDALADPDALAELRDIYPWLRCSYTPILDHVPSPGDRLPASLELDPGRRWKAATALDSVLSRGPSEPVVAEAERLLRGARLDEMGMDTVESALLALTYSECADRAAPWCDGLIEDATNRQAPSRHARLRTIRAEISFRQGDLLVAERHARYALDAVADAGWGVTVGGLLANLLLPLLAMGRDDEAEEELGRAVPQGMLQSRYGLNYLQARGRCRLRAGSVESAVQDFQLCGDLMTRWNMDSAGLIAWRLDLAEARLAMGDRDEARRLLQEQLKRCGRTLRRTRGITMRMLAATVDGRRRLTLLHQAADVLESVGDRYELARALTELTAAYITLGEPRRASVIGRRAWGLAKTCHALPLIRRLAVDVGPDLEPGPGPEAEDGSPGSGVPSLTEAERRVVQLAGAAYTNAEIAKRLYVTVSTVEQHLTRAYRKLNVTNRADLSSVLQSV